LGDRKGIWSVKKLASAAEDLWGTHPNLEKSQEKRQVKLETKSITSKAVQQDIVT